MRFAVDLGVGDDRREIVGRVGAPVGGDALEVLEELQQRLLHRLRAPVARQLRVVRPEHLLGEREHAREVVLGQAEDREDHVQRVVHGDVGDEVALAAEVGHPVDVALRQLGDAVAEPADRSRLEPVGR